MVCHWHPEIPDSGAAVLQRFLVPASAPSWGCGVQLVFHKVRTSAFQVHWNYRRFAPVTKQPLPSQNMLMQCGWSYRASNRTRRCRNKLFPRGVSDPLMYLGVSCGQTKASAATWILFSACMSLPYHSHPFLGGKVAVCATFALSLWQCQAVNTLHWIHWIHWI